MNSRELFRAASEGKKTPRAPFWIMRQAGRYLPEYRKLKEKYGFLEIVKTPELFVELFGIAVKNCYRPVAVLHQTTVHHQGGCSFVGIEEKLRPRHEKEQSHGSFFRIFDFCFQKLKSPGSQSDKIRVMRRCVINNVDSEIQIAEHAQFQSILKSDKAVKRRTAKATKRTIFKPPRSKKLVFLQ